YGFAIFVRRTRHLYFALATFAFAEIVYTVLRNWDGFSGGVGAESFVSTPLVLFGHRFRGDGSVFWLLLGVLVVVLLIGTFIARSPVEREAVAGRDNTVV